MWTVVSRGNELKILYKYVRLLGRPYIHTCRSYARTLAIYCRMQAWPARSPIRPILGFWESKVPQDGRFPAQDADEPPCKIRCH